MRIEMLPFSYFMDWLKVKTEEEVVAWLHSNNVKITGDDKHGYVNAIEFEVAYDRPAIKSFIEKYGENWVKYYLSFMQFVHVNMNDTGRVKIISEVIKNLYEGKLVSTDPVISNSDLPPEPKKSRKRGFENIVLWKEHESIVLLEGFRRLLLKEKIISPVTDKVFEAHFINDLQSESTIPPLNWEKEQYFLPYLFNELYDKGFLNEKFKLKSGELLANHFTIKNKIKSANSFSQTATYFKGKMDFVEDPNKKMNSKEATYNYLKTIINTLVDKRTAINKGKH